MVFVLENKKGFCNEDHKNIYRSPYHYNKSVNEHDIYSDPLKIADVSRGNM